MERLFTFINEIKLDLRKLRSLLSLSSLVSKISITSFFVILTSFILFPFIYLFIFLIFTYKYFAKYFFLLVDILFLSIVSDPMTISYFDTFIYYFRLLFLDMWFSIIPQALYKLLGYITKENMNKLLIKILIFIDTKAFNLFIYFERNIPRWWYRFKINSFKIRHYFYKYKSYITTREGQRFTRRVYWNLWCRFSFYSFSIIKLIAINFKYLFYYIYLKFKLRLFIIKQKFVLSINLFINLNIYKIIRIIYLLFFIILSFFYKLVEIIFGY